MSEETKMKATLSRRAFVMAGVGTATFGVFSTRLYYLQIVKSQDYAALSEKNRFNFNLLAPSRGRILDRYGSPLATNKQDYRLVMVPEQVDNIPLVLSKLSNVINISKTRLEQIEKDIKKNPKFVPILIAEHLDWDVFAELNLKTPELPGVIPMSGEGRSYNYDGVFSHILGYVGKAGPEDVKADNDPLLRQPSFRIGKTGVEASQEKILRGKSGKLKVEVNAVGRIVREWPNPEGAATAGEDVWLTLDADLQVYSAKLFEEDSGGLAVIDVMTGELRTLLSMPTFDSNLFVSGISQKALDKLNSDERRPQYNKVVGGGYPPASTYKMAVMLAGLEQGVIDPTEKIFCTGKVNVGNRDFHCWRRKGHGSMDLADSLKQSCDVYYYEISQRLDMSKMRETVMKLGLGQIFNLGIAGQISGVVPDNEWKRARLGQSWRTGDSLNASIGQGFVLATPLQLATMTARIANGRKAISPRLVIDQNEILQSDLGLNEQHLNLVQRAMLSVCEEPGGTAFNGEGLNLEGVQLAGKTGTGQVRGISARERASGVLSNRVLPWHLRDHSIFVGYAPFDAPRFAAAAIVEHGGSGAGRAATIVRKVLRRALINDGIAEKYDFSSDGI